MYCAICGDDKKLGDPFRFWSPDDGWRFGRMCPYCEEAYSKAKPKKSDFAYEVKDQFGDRDEYIDAFYG